jgi:SAM-dependent MidA family methyltransferase
VSDRGRLLEFLAAIQVECGGSIPFRRFMAEALYHPAHGYYSSTIRGIGRRGDFTTWPARDGLLGRAIERWLAVGGKRHVIEVGAGEGSLAAEVLGAMGWLRRQRVTYHIVEVSPVLRELQRQRLRSRRVVWHDDVGSALGAAGGVADIFSNELVDAFPCRVFERFPVGWCELAIKVNDRLAEEVWRGCELPDSTVFDDSLPLGQRVEVHDSYRDWLAGWRGCWKSGRMLTVDYGGTMPGLYERRSQGTLRAYAHHQRLTGGDVYAAFGRRDITADVNFSDLIRWGEVLGLVPAGVCDLAGFLSVRSGDKAIAPRFAAVAEEFLVLEQVVPGDWRSV